MWHPFLLIAVPSILKPNNFCISRGNCINLISAWTILLRKKLLRSTTVNYIQGKWDRVHFPFWKVSNVLTYPFLRRLGKDTLNGKEVVLYLLCLYTFKWFGCYFLSVIFQCKSWRREMFIISFLIKSNNDTVYCYWIVSCSPMTLTTLKLIISQNSFHIKS